MPRKPTEMLSDADLAYIAEHVDHPVVALARELGRPYFTVHKARQRIARDGWVCALHPLPCAVCGEIVFSSGGHGRRVVHPRCKRARNAMLSRESRRRRPGQSTPYVRTYRQEHPDRAHALRETEKARLRERYPSLPAEVREALLDKAHEADQTDYVVTLEQANSSGAAWSAEEDTYLVEHPQEPARDTALRLGRTLWSVRTRRKLLRQAGLMPPPRTPWRTGAG
jgi:hypothetical protein